MSKIVKSNLFIENFCTLQPMVGVTSMFFSLSPAYVALQVVDYRGLAAVVQADDDDLDLPFGRCSAQATEEREERSPETHRCHSALINFA